VKAIELDYSPQGLVHLAEANLRIYRDAVDLAYRRGYADGERHARLTDAEFLDALDARIRADDELREAVQKVIRSTTAAIDAEKYRRKRDEGRRAA
jgi:hypothetical protein